MRVHFIKRTKYVISENHIKIAISHDITESDIRVLIIFFEYYPCKN